MFKKGHKHSKGRIKGAKNKKTKQWELLSDYLLGDGLERFRQELDTLDRQEYIKAYLMLLEYFKPKQARVESIVNTKDDLVIEINLNDAKDN